MSALDIWLNKYILSAIAPSTTFSPGKKITIFQPTLRASAEAEVTHASFLQDNKN